MLISPISEEFPRRKFGWGASIAEAWMNAETAVAMDRFASNPTFRESVTFTVREVL
jgi:hypothetical protein